MVIDNFGRFAFADLLMSERYAYDSNGYVEYIGYAYPGSREMDNRWSICKNIYSGSDVVEKVWAEGSSDQKFAWSSREDYTYS